MIAKHTDPGRFHRYTMICAAIAAPMMLSANAHAALTTWDYSGSTFQYADMVDDAPMWLEYDMAPTVGSSPLVDGIKIFGTGADDKVLSLTGADYVVNDMEDPEYRGNLLVMSGTGTIDGAAWQHPHDYISTMFGIGFDFSGGMLDIYRVDTSFTLLDATDEFVTGVGSGTGLGAFEPGGYGIGWEFQDRFGADISTAETFLWSVTFGYEWTGMAPEDTFNFSIPQNSIDIQVITPEPASALLVAASGLGVMRRRRQG